MGLGVSDRGSNDPLFDAPYIDVDEWRDEPVRHRFVHGGFEGTDARFAMYFPPPERYQGRFFQPLMPVPGTEYGAASGALSHVAGLGGYIGFCSDSGALPRRVEPRLQDAVPRRPVPTCHQNRTSAAVARYSRQVAAEMYGDHRPFGYVYGGSGGAFKTISCVENHLDVWDGALPYVHGTPKSIPVLLIAPSHVMRVVGDKLAGVVDALEPGGSGDMFEGLDAGERDALAEITRLGFSPRIWFDVDRIAAQYQGGVWSMLVDGIRRGDPGYFDDFWTVPGYLGADDASSLAKARVKQDVTVSGLVSRGEALDAGLRLPLSMLVDEWADAPAAVRLDGPAQGRPTRRADGDHDRRGGGSDPLRRRRGRRPGRHRLRRGGPGGPQRRRGRRRGRARQLGVPRRADLPPSRGRHRLPQLGAPPHRRPAGVPAALGAHRHRPGDPDRALRVQDDRGPGAHGRGRGPDPGGVVPASRRRATR